MSEGAERICRRILADAQARVEAIAADAAQRSRVILEEAAQEAEKRREQILGGAQKEAEEQKRRILGIAQLEARKEMLAAKQELINEAFQQALQALLNLDDFTYLTILRRMLLAAIKTGDEVVILSRRDKARVPAEFWEDLNRELAAAGKEKRLSLGGEDSGISGGFILQSGGVEINNTFSSLLEKYRDELELEVAALLFKEE